MIRQTTFEAYSAINKSEAAFNVHEEGSYLSKEIIRAAIDKKANFLEDKVFSNYNKLEKEIDKLVGKGYKVKVFMSYLPVDEAKRRIKARYERTGRDVPEEYVEHCYSEINPTFEKLKKKGLSNKGLIQIAQFDMNVERGEAPKLKFIDKAE